MAETNAKNKNAANKKQVDVKVKYVETDPNEFCTKTCPADLTLIIEGRSLLVSRFLLGNLSPVFDAMFSGDFREKDNQTVTLPGKKFNNFVEFMRCMNPRNPTPVSVDNVYDVLPMAYEYEVKYLLTSCETTLMKLSETAEDKLYNILKIATMYNLNELTVHCMKLAADSPHGQIEEIGRSYELDKNTINAVKAQMLTNLTTKHKDIFVHITTFEALYRFLGIKSKNLKLLSAFKNGKVLGDFRKLQVSTALKESFDMCIDGNIFSMVIKKSKQSLSGDVYKAHNYICLTTKLKYVQVSPVECVSGIYIKNWIDEKEDIYREKTSSISESSTCTLTLPDEYCVDFMLDKNAGYVKEGIFDVEVYLLIVNK